MTKPLRTHPWSESVERVIFHCTDYLSFAGKPLPGGRQRHLGDLASAVRDRWKRDVLIVQKGTHDFETTCPEGFRVRGLRCDTTSRGDPKLGLLTRRLAGPADGVVYAGGEDAWPFFAPRGKGIQHGIWWDGPLALQARLVQRRRALGFVRSMQSVLCVDTNFINWVRGQGADGLDLCNKCVYVPNYADTARIPAPDLDRPPHDPVRILFARRYERKRGTELFIEMLSVLLRLGLVFHADLLTIGGVEPIRARVRAMGLEHVVSVAEESMDGILARYAHADIAVVPTLWSEGTSLAAVEAICAGVPVVATPVGGLGNVIIPHVNGYLVPPEPRALADAVRGAIRPETWRRLRSNCLAMRPALSLDRWRSDVLTWIAG